LSVTQIHGGMKIGDRMSLERFSPPSGEFKENLPGDGPPKRPARASTCSSAGS
jgi:hypothetical protein